MAIDERRRQQLHEAARQAFGDDAAVTLMEMLPPVGWAHVATKRDLDQLEERLEAKFDLIDARFVVLEDRLRREMAQLQTRLVLWFVGTGVAVVGATGLLRFS